MSILKTNTFFSLLLVLFSVLIFSSCKSGKQAASSSASSSGKILSEDERNNLAYNFVNANKEKLLGNEDKAAELFAQCLRIDPKNDASMYELAQIYASRKKYNDALSFARNAASLNPKNVWYKMLLADLLQRAGKWDEAVSIYQSLSKETPGKAEYYYQWAQALLFAGKAAEAIKVYDEMEKQFGTDRELIIQKERLYLKLNKIDKAAAEIEKLITQNPSDMEAFSMLYDVYSVNNMPEKAYETIERMKKVSPNDPRVFLNLANYYRIKGEKEKSFENLKLAFTSRELDSDIKVKILSSYLPLVQQDSSMLSQSLELSKLLSETHPAEANCQAIFGDFLTFDKKFELALEQYHKSLSLNDKNVNVWQQLLINQSELKKYEEMAADGEKAIELFPNESSLYLLTGIAKAQLNKTDDAISVFLQGSKMVVDNNAQLIQFYSNLGDAYNKQKKFSESDSYYDKVLEVDPKEVFVLNNYAYYLSLRNEKLDKAESMSKLSNQLQPNQSSFLDTYAWILFRQQKFDEAKKWQEKAMDNGGDKSGTILEHYGDILFKLNDATRAMEFWLKAKQAGGASDLLDKKITDRTYYE